MASFSLSATHQQESWLKYTITINGETSAGKIKINSIIGSHNYATGDEKDCTKNITHTLSFPGGTGSVTTFSGTAQSGVGTGWKCNNGSWTWGISGAPLEFSGSGTGDLKLTIASNSINYWPSNVTFNFGSITIPTPVVKPTITDPSVSNITYNGASASFTISSDGGGTVTSSGIQFSTSNWGSVAASISGTSGSVNTLSRNTTYYYRAYATNSAGTTYSTVKNFTTKMQTPTLTAPSFSNITSTGADVSFTITDNGGGTITASRTDASVNSSFSPIAGQVSGTSGTFSNLSPGTYYYAQSMARNSQYTGWSSNSSFSTCPTVTISPSSSSDGSIINVGALATGTVSQWYYSLYDENGTALVTDATPGQTISGYTFGNNQITGLSPGVRYGVSVRVTNTQGTYHNTTGTTSGIQYVTMANPSAINFSTNGGTFSPKPLYISINGGAYKLITKDKLNIL